MSLGPARSEALRRLFASVSDEALNTLDAALAAGAQDSAAALAASAHSGEERRRRAVRDEVFAPLRPPAWAGSACDAGPAGVFRPPFDPTLELWRALGRSDPEAVAAAVAAVRDRDEPEAAAAAADALTARAAERLAGDHPAWARLTSRLAAADPAAPEGLRRLLELCPVVRAASPRAQALARAPSEAHAAALRLAFRDAEARSPGCGPLLLSTLAAHLDRPWRVMRLVSAVMDRPSDAYLAASELAPFGQAVLDAVDARIAALRAFDGTTGVEGGAAAADAALACTLALAEFDAALRLNPEGAWARRTGAQRRELAFTVERRLKDAALAVDRALPVEPPRLKGRVRGAPVLGPPLDGDAMRRAQGLLAFFDRTRSSADFGGFGAVRARLIEELDQRLDVYAEDLLELLRTGAAAEREHEVRERLNLCAECLGLIREPRAAGLLRRRAAAA